MSKTFDIEGCVPGAILTSPASATQIAAVEAELRFSLPPPLRDLYCLHGNIREPLGNANYLLPLTGPLSLLGQTQFFHNQLRQLAPHSPDLTGFVFFGSSSADTNWGIAIESPHVLIGYHHHMGDEFEPLGADLKTLFQRDFRELQALAANAQ